MTSPAGPDKPTDTAETTAVGWHAVKSDSPPGGRTDPFPWQPALRHGGLDITVDMFFGTQAQCERFIGSVLLGRGWYPNDSQWRPIGDQT